jgi:hypothetical protein
MKHVLTVKHKQILSWCTPTCLPPFQKGKEEEEKKSKREVTKKERKKEKENTCK